MITNILTVTVYYYIMLIKKFIQITTVLYYADLNEI